MPSVGYSPADCERWTPEAGKPGDERSPWEIDRARILHSAAFRRLQRKTQVFAPAEGDFFRTRLTHSIEVSQIAKGIALRVGADPTLCEAASLAHDIGHPPFGHAGERVLNECMEGFGGFEGNAQNLRVLATLEVKSDAYPGLNLTRATLDALLKYKRSYAEARSSGRAKFFYDDDLGLVEWLCAGRREERTSFECQIMDWADDVAYSVHDVEDGMWAGLIQRRRLAGDGLAEAIARAVPRADARCIEAVMAELRPVVLASGERERKAVRKMWSSKVIYEMVHAASARQVADAGRGPRYGWALEVDPGVRLKSEVLKALAGELVFNHRRVASVQPAANRIVGQLFQRLVSSPSDALFPRDVREQLQEAAASRERIVCDYVSGMTDDFARRIFTRLVRRPPS